VTRAAHRVRDTAVGEAREARKRFIEDNGDALVAEMALAAAEARALPARARRSGGRARPLISPPDVHSLSDWRTDMGISAVPFEGRRSKLLRWLTCTAIVGCVLLPTASAAAATPAVAPPRASLTALWWKAYVSIPASEATTRCDLGIDKIVFLGATTGEDPEIRSCTLPAGTSILVPLINIECSSLEDPPFFGATPAERRACAKGFADDFTGFFLTINAVDVGDLIDLSGLRVQSTPFVFSPVAGNLFRIPAGTGGSASDGNWALIGPLVPGTYDVTFGGDYVPVPGEPPVFSTSVTYHLTVV
jgi:hypothetical protein